MTANFGLGLLLAVMVFISIASCTDTTTEIEKNPFPPLASIFESPPNQRLTEQQIKMYILAKQEIRRLRSPFMQDVDMKKGVKVLDNIERKVIIQLEINELEYSWVKEQIILADTRLMLSDVYDLNEDIITKFEEILHFHTKKRDTIKDKMERILHDKHVVEIRTQLAQLRSKLSARTKMTPAMRHNVQLVRKFTDSLNNINGIKPGFEQ